MVIKTLLIGDDDQYIGRMRGKVSGGDGASVAGKSVRASDNKMIPEHKKSARATGSKASIVGIVYSMGDVTC